MPRRAETSSPARAPARAKVPRAPRVPRAQAPVADVAPEAPVPVVEPVLVPVPVLAPTPAPAAESRVASPVAHPRRRERDGTGKMVKDLFQVPPQSWCWGCFKKLLSDPLHKCKQDANSTGVACDSCRSRCTRCEKVSLSFPLVLWVILTVS
jgi:hypothetical protein